MREKLEQMIVKNTNGQTSQEQIDITINKIIDARKKINTEQKDIIIIQTVFIQHIHVQNLFTWAAKLKRYV